MRFVWIPEAPKHPGLYANESGTDIRADGKIQTRELQPSTYCADKAKQFATREECQKWCDENPVPAFEPREHGFYDEGDEVMAGPPEEIGTGLYRMADGQIAGNDPEPPQF